MIESGHSRFPVVGEDRDEVAGILLAKDLLRFFVEDDRDDFDIRECLRPAVFIPESKRLNVLLKEFRVSHNHMAIVVDEYGGVSGLLTIEDVLEQIVGDIGDEYDVDEGEGIRKEADRTWAVPALTRIEEFNAAFGTRFTDEEYDTIGGLVLHELGRMPRRGETIQIGGLELKVTRADRRRIEALRVDDDARPRTRAPRMAADRVPGPGALQASSGTDAGSRCRSALLLALAFAPADQWYLAVLCPAALFVLWHGAAPREAAMARPAVHERHLPRRHVLAVSQHPPRRAGARLGRAVPDAGARRDHGCLHGAGGLRRRALGASRAACCAGSWCCRRSGC